MGNWSKSELIFSNVAQYGFEELGTNFRGTEFDVILAMPYWGFYI
jgi:hypothetical protein